MEALLILLLIAVLAAWIGTAWWTRSAMVHADSIFFATTDIGLAEARDAVTTVGKPRNPMALNKPTWESPSVWTRRFDKGMGKRHSDAVLQVRIYEPGDPESPQPGHQAGVVVAIEIVDWHVWKQYGIVGSDGIRHAWKVGTRILQTVAPATEPVPAREG